MLTFSDVSRPAATDAVTALVTICKLTKANSDVLATFSTLAYGAANAAGLAALVIDATTTTSATATGLAALAKFYETGGSTLVYTASVGQKVVITGGVQGNKTFIVAEDKSAIAFGQKVTVSGSTGNTNDGVYTAVSAVGAGPTTITVHEAIPGATVDGAILCEDLAIDNVSINGPPNAQTVNITSHSITVAP